LFQIAVLQQDLLILYSIGPIPAILFSYPWDIRVTFQVHSKYILGIPAAFCLNSWTLEPYSAAIPRAFWLHSYSIRGTFQLDFRRLPNYIRAAFES